MAKILKILLVLAVLLGFTFGAYAWLQSRDGKDDGLKKIEVTAGSITDKAVAVGKIEPRVKFHVKSKISGIVKHCSAEVGDAIKAGDPLFEIVPDPTPAERVEVDRRLELAQSAYDRAAAEMDRAKSLSLSGILSRGDYDLKKEAFEQARIQLAQAKDNVDLVRKGRIQGGGIEMESIVRAPAAGTLLERLVGALPDKAITGKLTRIAPQATEKDNAKLFEVEIELDPGQEAVLRAGYSANADLVIKEKKDILLVPERVVTFEDGGKKTFVEIPGASPKAEPKKVEITTGLSDGLNCEVVAGLKKGDLVIQRPPKEKSDM